MMLIPYTILSYSGEAGIVIENQVTDKSSLPSEIQDLLRPKSETYNLILIEDQLNKVTKEGLVSYEKKLVISKETQPTGSFKISEDTQPIGSFVIINDITSNIMVTSYDIIDQPFDKLIMGSVKKPSFANIEYGWIIEKMNYYNLKIILTLSRLDFIAGGFFVVLIMTFMFHRWVALWNIPAMGALYSIEFLLAVIISFMSNIEVDGITMLFGSLFIVFIPLAIWIKNYEETEKGKKKISELYAMNNNILLRIKKIFGR